MNDIQKVEYNGILVLTTQQIAEAYETSTDTVTKNFNRNKDRYVSGKHYICLEGEELRDFKTNGQIDLSLKLNKLYLWTKKGAFLHAKSLNTDTAWEVYDRLVDSYFEPKQNIAVAELSPELQMFNKIFTSVAKQELEQKRQAEQLNRIEKKQEVISDTFTHTSTDEDFKVWVNRCISKIAESPHYVNGSGRSARYQNVRTESYDRLRQKWNCNLNDRVARAKGRALENKPNITKKELDSINKLSVISEDKSLKPVYETVIKEMMICYCVNIS